MAHTWGTAKSGKVNRQEAKANTRAKYGPSMRPAPVVVKSLATGEIIASSKCAPSPDDVQRAMTKNGGWTRATLATWGVPWPPPRGWRRRLAAQWEWENAHD